MSQYPRYLARPSDGTVWSLNEDGLTYTIKSHKEDYPDSHHFKHGFSLLDSLGFYQVSEEDFPKLEEKGKEYYEYISWSSRNDGHGGCKGGTIEEFRKLKK